MAVARSKFTDVEIPEDITYHELILRHFDLYGNRKAIMDGVTGRSYTFKQIKELVWSFGSALVKRGFKKGDVLSIYLPNIPEYIIVFYGVLSIGGVVTTVNPSNTERELLHQLKDSGAKYLVTIPKLADNATSAARKAGVNNVFVFGSVEKCESAWDLLKDDGNRFPTDVRINTKEDVCVLPYSSGTTGIPKGVMITHYNLVSFITLSEAISDADKRYETANGLEVSLGLLPFYHAYGMLVSLGVCMIHRMMVIALPKFEPEMFLKYIQEYKITSLAMVPPILVFLAKHPIVEKFNLSSINRITCGAAPLGKDAIMALKRRLPKLEAITQGYGLTEATLACTVTPLNDVKPGSSGILIPNMMCKIVDMKTGEILRDNQDGEILIKGPTIMKGYINKPLETAMAVDKDGWLRTGDIGHLDADGHIYIVGRIKELIKYNAFQVAPAELEALLLTNPKIADAAVVGVPDPLAGELPKAFIVKKGEITHKEVGDFVAARVAPYKKLRGGVEFVDQIPKNPSGKILRRVLREKEAERKQNNLRHKL